MWQSQANGAFSHWQGKMLELEVSLTQSYTLIEQ